MEPQTRIGTGAAALIALAALIASLPSAGDGYIEHKLATTDDLQDADRHMRRGRARLECLPCRRKACQRPR